MCFRLLLHTKHDNGNNSVGMMCAMSMMLDSECMANSVQALLCSVALSTALVTGRIGYGQAPILSNFLLEDTCI